MYILRFSAGVLQHRANLEGGVAINNLLNQGWSLLKQYNRASATLLFSSRRAALKHVFRMTWHEQNLIFLCFSFVPRVRLKLFEQRGSLLSFLFVAWMDCAVPLWAACTYVELIKVFCLHNEPHLCRLFLFCFYPPYLLLSFSLIFPQLDLSGNSFFPVFYPIVFEKGLFAHPEPDGRPHSVLPTLEQRWRERRLVYSLVEGISALGPRWKMVRADPGKNKRYDANKHSRIHPPPHPPHPSHSFTLTLSLMQWVIPVFAPSDC